MKHALLLVALALCCGTALTLNAQSAAPSADPPIKLGLWEKKIVTSGGSTGPSTMTARSCVTKETWQQMAANAMKQRPGCTMKSSPAPHGFTFNATCTLDRGITMNVSGSSTVQDSTHIVSDSHSTTTFNGQTRVMDSRSTSTFVGSDCGSVKPGEPEINRK